VREQRNRRRTRRDPSCATLGASHAALALAARAGASCSRWRAARQIFACNDRGSWCHLLVMALRPLSPLLAAAALGGCLGACSIDTHLGSSGDSSQEEYPGPHVCSIGMSPANGDFSAVMAPGEPCISCHLTMAPTAPTALGGTVFQT